jgi:hypothetical protein
MSIKGISDPYSPGRRTERGVKKVLLCALRNSAVEFSKASNTGFLVGFLCPHFFTDFHGALIGALGSGRTLLAPCRTLDSQVWAHFPAEKSKLLAEKNYFLGENINNFGENFRIFGEDSREST